MKYSISKAILTFLLFLGFSTFTLSSELKIKAEKQQHGLTENKDRAVDGAALQAQEVAIGRLQGLLQKHRGKRQESTLLIRLAESQQQAAGILFRLSHGNAQLTKRTIDYTKYHKALRESIGTLGQVITRFPQHEEMNKAYFMRGFAYEELKDVPKATADYLYITKHFPGTEEAISSHLSLAQFAAEQNKYEVAVTHLKEVEKFPQHRKYPVALYKMAWAYHNLKKVSAALGYIELHIRFYDRLLAEDQTYLASLQKFVRELKSDSGLSTENQGFLGASPEQAMRENSLMDAVVFYFEGTEAKDPNYPPVKAHAYFEDLAKLEGAKGELSGTASEELGKMVLRYAKLLRSRDLEPELLAFYREMVEKEHARPEVVEVVLTAYEHLQNRRKIKDTAETAKWFAKIFEKHPKSDRYAKAQQALLDTAKMIQEYLLKAKGKNLTKPDATPADLASVYETFTQIVQPGDLRVPRVHFNLAETLFDIGKYEDAVAHYRWIVDRGGDWNLARTGTDGPAANAGKTVDLKTTEKEKLLVSIAEASLRSIAARYEALLQDKLVPRNLVAVAYPENDPDRSKLEGAVQDWIKWIDTHQNKVKAHRKAGESLEAFLFEAARTLYSQGYIRESIDRLKQLVELYPTSKFAISASTLHIDTAIASQRWKEVIVSADHYQKLFSKFRNDADATKFMTKIASLSADAQYKLIEQDYKAENYQEVIASVDHFRKKFPNEQRLLDLLQIAGTASRKANDMEMAKSFYSELLDRAGKDKKQYLGAYLLRGQILETQYQLKEASQDYLVFLQYDKGEGTEVDRNALRKKILLFSWISEDPQYFESVVKNSLICGGKASAEECNRYSILSQMAGLDKMKKQGLVVPSKELAKKAYQNSRNASGAEKALWGIVALSYPEFTNQHFELINMVRAVVNQWSEIDPLDQYSLLSRLHTVLPDAFRRMRHIVKEAGPLRASASQIKHRVEILKEIENTAGAVLKLKWAGVQSEVLSEIADLYIDFTQGIMQAGNGKKEQSEEIDASLREIVLPFEDKAQLLRRKAFELAGETGANPALLGKISESFFRDNPSQAKGFQHQVDVGPALALDLKFLVELSDSISDMKLVKDAPAVFAWEKAESKVAKLDKSPSNWNELGKSDRVRLRWYQALKAGKFIEVGYLLTLLQDKQSELLKQIHPIDFSLMRAVSLHEIGAAPEAWAEFTVLVKEGVAGKHSPNLPEWAVRGMYYLTKASLQSFAKAKSKSLLNEIVDLLQNEASQKVAWSAMESEDAAALLYAESYSGAEIDAPVKEEIKSRAGRVKRFINPLQPSAAMAHIN